MHWSKGLPMSPIDVTGHIPETAHVPAFDETSAGAVIRGSSHSESAAATSSSVTESSDFLKSYANDSAPEFHAPGGSTSTRSPEAAAGGASQNTTTPEADDFNSWLKSDPKRQKQYDKLDDAKKEVVREKYQEVSEGLNCVGKEAKALPNEARREVEDHAQNAASALKQGDLKVAKEHLDYANGALDKAKHAGGSQAGQNAEARKWPQKPDGQYPHKGKHKPGINTTKMSDSAINSQIKKESSNGKPAKYNTSVAADVNKLEAEAFEDGYETKHANGTAVHRFANNIGASEGHLTSFIRLDGTDHGHPITQDQFNKYIQKEADHLKKTGGDTTELSNYLKKIGENPQSFGITNRD
jgi:hypothetical protein